MQSASTTGRSKCAAAISGWIELPPPISSAIMARNRSPEGRNAPVNGFGDLIDETDRQFSDQELALIEAMRFTL